MKKPALIIALIIIISSLVLLPACSRPADVIVATGTVRFVEVEGGFYGIVADNTTRFDPLNLAEEFRQDGLRVRFEAKISDNQVSTHMWGTLIKLTKIEKLQ